MIFTPAKIFILNFRVYTIFYYLPQLRILSFKSIYICLFLPHCAGPEFMLCWLKLYSSDNHCTTVSPIKNPPLKVSVYLLKVQNTLFTDPSNIFNLNVSKKRMERACNKMQKAFINLTMPLLFFCIWVFCHDHSRITGLQGKGEEISLSLHYHFHSLHRHLATRPFFQFLVNKHCEEDFLTNYTSNLLLLTYLYFFMKSFGRRQAINIFVVLLHAWLALVLTKIY